MLWLQPSPIWPCGLMDKALGLGTKDCRFESCQGQFASQRPIMCVACVPVMCLYVAVPAAMRSCVGVHLFAYLCACAVVRAALRECARGLGKAPTVGLEPTTTRLRALRSAD